MKKIRIGGGSGFWGDSNDAAVHMVKHGDLQYMSCDFLSELTLSIMQKQKNRNPQSGYARDFIDLMEIVMAESFQKNIKILSDAGGVNVLGAVQQLEQIAGRKSLREYKIGYVLGDDLLDQLPELIAEGVEFKNMDDTVTFDEIKDKIVNVNVYFGHEPLEECLDMGADVVVAGRSTDSSLWLAPLAHEFGWHYDDWDRMARGVMVGHLLECGGQGSGGNFEYDWRSVPDMDQLGFPIAEVNPDGSFTITKASLCGGLVTEQTCKEQILYEIHDPSNYITPDVVADLSRVTLKASGKNRVDVANIYGKQRPDSLKLCVGFAAGYKVETYIPYAWPDAYEKAQYAADILMKKMKRKNLNAVGVQVDYLGLNALHGKVANMDPALIKDMNEVVLRMTIQTKEKEEAKKLVTEIAPLQLNGPPGSCFFGGRAKISEVIGLYPTFIPRDAVTLNAHILEVK